MATEPVTLARPAVLHRDDDCTIWHSGVVLGPPGLVTLRLDVDWIAPSNWHLRLPPEHPTVQAYIDGPHLPYRIMGECGYTGGAHELAIHATFPGRVRGRKGFPPLDQAAVKGSTLHLDLYPLTRHFTITLD